MPLFQASALRQQSTEHPAPESAWQEYTAFFHNPAVQENIRAQTEEQLQGEFLAKLFGDVLGYTLAPAEGHNLVREQKNELNARSADGALCRGGKICAVIELKDTRTTDLDKVEPQAFGYKNAHRGVRYVITSNFARLRFYIDSTLDYIEFDLFRLTHAEFSRLWFVLSKPTLLDGDLPARLFDSSRQNEQSITEKLYADYSAFKRELFDDILARQQGPLTRDEKLLLFRKTQKLLDRLIFIFFCEDRGLLPVNSTESIIKKWRGDRAWDPSARLYPQFLKFFEFINSGNPALGIFAYNGGLFARDEQLDALDLDDALLARWTQKLSDYDYETEVDVNILGHIFEHSLAELEEAAAAFGDGQDTPAVSKRKKDGVFYTPSFVTQFIVENTVGALCAEKKAELGITDDLFAPRAADPKKRGGKSDAEKREKLESLLAAYRAWLLDLKICDPACGSGAFLVAALQFLIREHKKIDRWSANIQTGAGALVFEDIDTSILERNLYGVDINEESVEIARLSLWLHTCRPGRKLSDLSANIKCGNSLITEEFDWEKEFPFGGFDAVIGNPPYVQLQTMGPMSDRYAKCGFEVFNKMGDIYCLFYELGWRLLKQEGVLGYISSNKWMRRNYGNELRKFFVRKTNPQILVDFPGVPVFSDANTDPVILVFRKAENQHHTEACECSAIPTDLESHFDENKYTADFDEEMWVLKDPSQTNLFEQMKCAGKPLKEWPITINYGIKTGFNEAFCIDTPTKERLIAEDPKSAEIIRPLLRGRDISAYYGEWKGLWLIFVPWHFPLHLDTTITGASEEAERLFQENYPAVYQHLCLFKNMLTARNKAETGIRYEWYALQRWGAAYYQDFAKPKIIYPNITKFFPFTYDTEKHVCLDTVFIITANNEAVSLPYLLAVLNSPFAKQWILDNCPPLGDDRRKVHKVYFENFPVPTATPEQTAALAALAEKRVNLTRAQQSVRAKFHRSLLNHFSTLKITQALETFETLTFAEFLKELKKQKAKPKLSEEAEWEEFFTASKTELLRLAAESAQTDTQINTQVAALYGLPPEQKKGLNNDAQM